MAGAVFEEGSESPLGEAKEYQIGPPVNGITTIVIRGWSGPPFSPHKKYQLRLNRVRVLASSMQLKGEKDGTYTFLAIGGDEEPGATKLP